MPAHYAVFLILKGRKCVVVGAGEIGERRIDGLSDSNAEVVVIGPDATDKVRQRAQNGHITWIDRVYEPGDLDGAFLAIAATNDREVNKRIAKEAAAAGVLLNVVDDPELCMFTAPSLVKRGDLTVAISTNGKSPAMARRVREDLEDHFPDNYGDLVAAAGEARDVLKQEGRQIAGEMWSSALGPVIDQFAGEGKGDKAKQTLLRFFRGDSEADQQAAEDAARTERP